MTAREYFGGWAAVLDIGEATKILRSLAPMANDICPSYGNIFEAFRLCPYERLKVIILGQDPYPQRGVATGIAFGNRLPPIRYNPASGGIDPGGRLSPSLRVLRESVIDFSRPHNLTIFDPSLETWERQGVLMLNSALTCRTGRPGSHCLLWRPFISSLLLRTSQNNPDIACVLMGKDAQSFERYIDFRVNCFLTVHPAACTRADFKFPPDLWPAINDHVRKRFGTEIEWYNEID